MINLFAATGDGLAHLQQQSKKWTASLKLQGQGIQCLALDPAHNDTLYAGSSGNCVWKSSDGGITWLHLDLPQTNIFSLAVSPIDGTVYAGCEPSMLFKSSDGLVRGANAFKGAAKVRVNARAFSQGQRGHVIAQGLVVLWWVRARQEDTQ